MFDFLEKFIAPLWGIVIIVFIALVVVISLTVVKSAKKKQKGIKPTKRRSDYYREIEPYSEMPYVRIAFDGKPPLYKRSFEKDGEIFFEEMALDYNGQQSIKDKSTKL